MRRVLLFALLLAGCSKGPEADLQYIKQARSLAAEWALVNDRAAQGKLTSTYVSSMHKIKALLDQPDDAAPDELQAHAGKLKQIEDQLESA